jgi:hypothetical protein
VRLSGRLGVIGAVLSAVILLVASPSSATSYTRGSPDHGASATYVDTTNTMRVGDTKCDGRYVYVLYGFTSSIPTNPTRFEWHGGCNTGTSFGVGGSGSWITWRVCTNYSGGPDSCSGWWTVPR